MRAPSRVELLDGFVLGLQIVRERPSWPAARAGEAKAARARDKFVAPAQFVVDEVAQAPGIAGRFVLVPGDGLAHGTGKTGIEDIGELAPVPASSAQRSCLHVNGRRVRRFVHASRFRRSDQLPMVFMPQLRRRRWTIVGKLRTSSRRRIFASGWLRRSCMFRWADSDVAPLRPAKSPAIKSGQRRIAAGRSANHCSRSVNGVASWPGSTQSTPLDQKSRPSGSTSHQRPSTLFHAETAGGRQVADRLSIRRIDPNRPDRDGRPNRRPPPLFAAVVLRRMDFAGPILVHILAEGIDHGKPLTFVGRQGKGNCAAGPDVGNLENVFGLGIVYEDYEFIDLGGIDAVFLVQAAGIAAACRRISCAFPRTFFFAGECARFDAGRVRGMWIPLSSWPLRRRRDYPLGN